MIEYQLLGNPKALHRPRFSRGKVYNDQKSQMLIDYLVIKSQHGKRSMFSEPVCLDIVFTFKIPESSSMTKRAQLHNTPYIGACDTDNLLKYIMDVCTGALYTNDNIVTNISAKKVYGNEAKTAFTLSKL